MRRFSDSVERRAKNSRFHQVSRDVWIAVLQEEGRERLRKFLLEEGHLEEEKQRHHHQRKLQF